MTTLHTTAFSSGLAPQPPDVLLSLIQAFRRDPRADKIDLGVGVYRTAEGATPVFAAIKAAERRLLEAQVTKAYLGPEGDLRFLELIQKIVFGEDADPTEFIGVQTPGGTGALRLAAELAHAAKPGARLWLGVPSWPIHGQIFARAGLEVATYRHYDARSGRLDFDSVMEALTRAAAGDLVLFHGCCHNPSGADFSPSQWAAVTEQVLARGLVPIVDLAYQGLGQGLEADALGARGLLQAADEAILAYSCDKNFGLYRERTGALFARARGHADAVRSVLLALARCAWSMPPDHGAATVRLVLESADLTDLWQAEVADMRGRLRQLRTALAAAHPRLRPLAGQQGLFAMLPLSPRQVEDLRRDHALYMAGSGRINLAGLNDCSIPGFVAALDAALAETPA